MCTLSVIPLPQGGYRLVHSRDEQRGRSPGLPLARRRLSAGGPLVQAPLDPDGGGTWIALRDDGLCVALLNVNPSATPRPGADGSVRSRGEVVGHVMARVPLGEAATVDDLRHPEAGAMRSYRVVALQRGDAARPARLTIARSHAEESPPFAGEATALLGPVCLVSSGLGDARVLPRLDLFREHVPAGASAAAQDGFHAHRWGDRPEISVRMSRFDARTVNITRVRVDERPEMVVEDVPDEPAAAGRE